MVMWVRRCHLSIDIVVNSERMKFLFGVNYPFNDAMQCQGINQALLYEPDLFPGSQGRVGNRVLTCDLRLPLRVEGVGHRVESRPGALSGDAHPHPHPLQLAEAV